MVLATSKSMPRQSGMHAAGDPAASSSAVAACESDFGALWRDSVGSAGSEENSKAGLKGPKPSNPWNQFQHANRNRGLTSTMLSKLYQDGKSKRA